MKHTIQMLENNEVMHSILEGDISLADFPAVMQERVSNPYFKSIKVLIADYTNVTNIDYQAAEI